MIFYRLKSNLINFGSFKKPRQKEYNKENREAEEINVLASVNITPATSCRKVETEVGVIKSRVQTILKKHKYKPYKIKVVQNLHPGDAERRLLFCEWYLQKINNNPNFGSKVIWSDESYICSNGIFNRQNNRYWSAENQHLIFPREQQGRFGFNVACFILGTTIKFHIFEGSITANRYLEILQNILPAFLEDVPLARLNEIYFQQDGAPAHNSQIVRHYLEENFTERWIGTHGPVRWPPRSPDLSVLDFFLWGHLKNLIFRTRHDTVGDLRNATELAFAQIQARNIIITNALRKITKVCEKCVRANGNHFEQFF